MQASSTSTPPAADASATQALPATSASPHDVARDMYAMFFTLNQRVARDLFQMLSDMGLSITQFKLLHFLLRDPTGDGMSVKALGEQFSLSLAAASRAVDGLHQRGFVTRAECQEDRRSKRVRLTPAGRDAITELHATNIALLATFTAELTDDQRRALADAIAPLLGMLDLEPSKEGPSA
ncbi:MarR family transcriptional regulator [Conexibacter sp. JD483]|uniref:MarR family winged helix-turn-helix transcriptional regulator n=1 Tax=unclassified Conexibacter TaxID=2627773 RepID=UPI0027167D5B|nr:MULTISPECIES: MarR family transcriptional regulator [unclassified Conexibacter]MDO8187163.1 MarR family transcriptional regulator [Conexibacter sp. CPCC 205706]MDO8200339.1 MarR family transcriptional regulator [Conexibacter sp. CPCC 205762]MDR9368865.1 MarR family transcriptional regulator [Conexibacter sp. JD483]